MKNNATKQKVMDAACQLFFTKGYHGTSVRDIAKLASVNVSLINYYFKSKQGLLESTVTSYYEQYLDQVETTIAATENQPKTDRLKKLIETIIQYKQGRHQFSCFIQRELTLDSMFVREMMVTYMAKENYLLGKVFNDALTGTNHTQVDRKFLFIQLKGMLSAPYISANEWKHFVEWDQSQDFFTVKYMKLIYKWVDHVVGWNASYQKSGTANTLLL
ncbi:forespore capture DNA-binding protein RefZ [Sediminibacillus massiliensis]|uniref:forespore capture DNA-binding protein RefZ n=1 Tax=Sediminibacillus massiliensis TaxID=1926277 RepID=UPI0009887477|nr:forespore capture DNA-binding protein RefZ [Sediminibacillus massiliensis]